MHMYRLQLVVKLLLNERNNVRDKIIDSYQLGLMVDDKYFPN